MLVSRQSARVTAAQLRDLPLPPALGPVHQPLPHALLVEKLRTVIKANNYQVAREDLAIARNGHRLFGVMDLLDGGPLRDRGFAIGFHNSTDTSLSIQIVAGSRVFVCDNLVLSGDFIALKRRNTAGLDLEDDLETGFSRYLEHASLLDAKIGALQETPITDDEAKLRTFDVFAQRVLPSRLFSRVERAYFNPTDAMPDCQPRTLWGLHNACSRALQKLPPARAFEANVALGRLFGLGWAQVH